MIGAWKLGTKNGSSDVFSQREFFWWGEGTSKRRRAGGPRHGKLNRGQGGGIGQKFFANDKTKKELVEKSKKKM